MVPPIPQAANAGPGLRIRGRLSARLAVIARSTVLARANAHLAASLPSIFGSSLRAGSLYFSPPAVEPLAAGGFLT
jgi:hypothetical protein